MKKLIGHIGVDSGQVLICDPCYIDSQWKNEEFANCRKYKHNDGTILQYGKEFSHYMEIIPKYGKTMNDILEAKEAIELPDDAPEHPFSYNACCQKTLGKDGFGQLNYEMGHEGVGVVSQTGFGDGFYPVIADIDGVTGRVRSITINFMDDENGADEEE